MKLNITLDADFLADLLNAIPRGAGGAQLRDAAQKALEPTENATAFVAFIRQLYQDGQLDEKSILEGCEANQLNPDKLLGAAVLLLRHSRRKESTLEAGFNAAIDLTRGDAK